MCVATFAGAQIDDSDHKYLTIQFGVLSLKMLEQHRDTNCVFITEENCWVKSQKEGRGILARYVCHCYERVPCPGPGTALDLLQGLRSGVEGRTV